MKPHALLCRAVIVTFTGLLSASAATRYVNVSNTNPVPPYPNWATAATVIQDAIDVAEAGDEIVVSNGIYQTGGRAVYPGMTNRLAVTKPLTVRSVNGPDLTVIRGYQVPGTTNGDGAVRCAYLTNGAALAGFTLTNGATLTPTLGLNPHQGLSGGGVWCESVSAVISNCVLRGNSALNEGGGAYGGTLINCTLIGNSANSGGGISGYDGGKHNGSTLNNCTLIGNSARSGGGALSAILNNCTLTGNSATDNGGGVVFGVLNNCVLTGNSAGTSGGGGAYGATLNNCTVTGNSAGGAGGGGTSYGTLDNCIVYYNTGRGSIDNYEGGTFNYSCTTPLPANGVGNITVEPQLVAASHISATSPCRAAGSVAYVSGLDIDAEPWANPPSIGCDEVHLGTEAGPLSVGIQVGFTNVAAGFEVNFTAQIVGNASASVWEFGDRTAVTNRPFASHVWLLTGDYSVVLRVYNQTYPNGVSAIVTMHVTDAVHYVAAASTNAVAPYSSWATAARRIQDAVDEASVGGALILVTNGVYDTGGRAVHGTMTNRVAVTKPLTVRSVNGPNLTVIRGYQGTTNGAGAVRCVYLTNGAALVGFTLTNGAGRGGLPGDPFGVRHELLSGGGVWCESFSPVVSNCVLTGNSAIYGGGAFWGTLNRCQLIGNIANSGGGAVRSSLNDCVLTGNSVSRDGGGAYFATLNRCSVSGNTGQSGGGVFFCTLTNCSVRGNSATVDGGGARSSRLYNCILVGNTAQSGGGAYGGEINNCTVVGNAASSEGGGIWAFSGGGGLRGCDTIGCSPLPECHDCVGDGAIVNNSIILDNAAPEGANHFGFTGVGYEVADPAWWGLEAGPIGGQLSYSCTAPMPTNNIGNITNAPLFVDYVGGNLRLQSNSPCINAGRNAFAPSGPDLDGSPRIVGGTVDIGAYEFQSPQSTISYAWLQLYGLPTDGSADLTDPDGDGQNNWQEWRAWTDPTNSLSALRLLAPSAGTDGILIGWQSVSGQTYSLERSTNLGVEPSFVALCTNIVGQSVATTYADTNAPNPQSFFYRVRIEE